MSCAWVCYLELWAHLQPEDEANLEMSREVDRTSVPGDISRPLSQPSVLISVAASGPLPPAVRGLSSCGVRAQSPRVTWGLSAPTRGHSCVPRVAGWFLNHRTTRDILGVWFCRTLPVPPLSPVMLGNPLKVWPVE